MKRKIHINNIKGISTSSLNDEFVIHCTDLEHDYHYSSTKKKLIIQLLNESYYFLNKVNISLFVLSTETLSSFTTLKTDKIAQDKKIPKTGPCTARFNKLFPDAKTNLQKSRVTGIPKRILDKVLNKGEGAFYSSGSRPGQTAVSWGIARVNCFIMNKKTVTAGPDKDLFQEALKYPKAKKWFSNL